MDEPFILHYMVHKDTHIHTFVSLSFAFHLQVRRRCYATLIYHCATGHWIRREGPTGYARRARPPRHIPDRALTTPLAMVSTVGIYIAVMLCILGHWQHIETPNYRATSFEPHSLQRGVFYFVSFGHFTSRTPWERRLCCGLSRGGVHTLPPNTSHVAGFPGSLIGRTPFSNRCQARSSRVSAPNSTAVWDSGRSVCLVSLSQAILFWVFRLTPPQTVVHHAEKQIVHVLRMREIPRTTNRQALPVAAGGRRTNGG